MVQDKATKGRAMKRQFIYAVLFRSGLVKIGRSEQPKNRVRMLGSKLGAIDGAWCAECYWFSATKVEQSLLQWAAGIGNLHRTAKELFEGLSIGMVLTRLKQISLDGLLTAIKTIRRNFVRVAPRKPPVVVSWTNEFGTWTSKKPKPSKYS